MYVLAARLSENCAAAGLLCPGAAQWHLAWAHPQPLDWIVPLPCVLLPLAWGTSFSSSSSSLVTHWVPLHSLPHSLLPCFFLGCFWSQSTGCTFAYPFPPFPANQLLQGEEERTRRPASVRWEQLGDGQAFLRPSALLPFRLGFITNPLFASVEQNSAAAAHWDRKG